MPTTTIDDTIREFICEALLAGRQNVRLDFVPAFASLKAVLKDGTPGRIRMGFEAGPDSLQGNGVVGGGVVANMLDCAIATAVLSALSAGASCATINLSVNMLRSARIGELTVVASVDKVGRRVAFAQAQLFDKEERLIATANSSLALFGEEV